MEKLGRLGKWGSDYIFVFLNFFFLFRGFVVLIFYFVVSFFFVEGLSEFFFVFGIIIRFLFGWKWVVIVYLIFLLL